MTVTIYRQSQALLGLSGLIDAIFGGLNAKACGPYRDAFDLSARVQEALQGRQDLSIGILINHKINVALTHQQAMLGRSLVGQPHGSLNRARCTQRGDDPSGGDPGVVKRHDRPLLSQRRAHMGPGAFGVVTVFDRGIDSELRMSRGENGGKPFYSLNMGKPSHGGDHQDHAARCPG